MNDSLRHDLTAYYDQDAPIRAGRPLSPIRLGFQQRFVDLLAAERRHRVVDFGCGPGRDSQAFVEAGHPTTGLDLSAEHFRHATTTGFDRLQASLLHPPLRPGSFDAGWSMSTLVHVPDDRFDEAMSAIRYVLQPGAPLGLGMWGGGDHEGPSVEDTISPPRFFSRRSHDRVNVMLAAHGEIEVSEIIDPLDRPDWQYQFAILRV